MALDAVRIYTKQLRQAMVSVFQKRAAFTNAFAAIQYLDGISHNATAFTVKTNDQPTAINDYLTGANDGGFGTAGGANSRFGPLSEIKYEDVDVGYDTPYAFNEGLDAFTTNEDLDYAANQRLIKAAEALLDKENTARGLHLSTNAGTTIVLTGGTVTEASLKTAFSTAAAWRTNFHIIGAVTAFLNTESYNILVESGLTTVQKNSATNIDTNEVRMYKGFIIQEEADAYFAENEVMYFSANGINLPFVGIEIARALTAVQNFAGTNLQGAGKGGRYVDDVNKMAILKVATE